MNCLYRGLLWQIASLDPFLTRTLLTQASFENRVGMFHQNASYIGFIGVWKSKPFLKWIPRVNLANFSKWVESGKKNALALSVITQAVSIVFFGKICWTFFWKFKLYNLIRKKMYVVEKFWYILCCMWYDLKEHFVGSQVGSYQWTTETGKYRNFG